jgi:GDP-4-dehydro-6-deoxy-D-mannose reductase
MRALITGIAGFCGSYLAEFLLKKKGIVVLGVEAHQAALDNVAHIKDKIRIYRCDITRQAQVDRVIKNSKPEYIFHLAAQAHVGNSWKLPRQTLNTNILGTLNILEAVRKSRIHSHIQISCSAEEYGAVCSNELPIKESAPLRPLNPYAVSKVGQDMLGYQYGKNYQMCIVRTRAFNHIGPRMRECYAASDFARQIALIEKGVQEPVIRVGNLDAVRDEPDKSKTWRSV